jgi:hypothetical protein
MLEGAEAYRGCAWETTVPAVSSYVSICQHAGSILVPQAEPYAEDAISFTREHALQRDVEITVDTMDKGGTFLGTLTVLPASPQVCGWR